MSSIHATELASLTSEVTRLASLSDDVLALVLRDLPREALLRLRLKCQDVCARVSMLLSDERVSRTLHFERRLRVPDSLDGVPDVAACLRRLCNRFGIKPNTWSLSLTVRAQADSEDYAFLCSGVSAREVLAAVEAVTPVGHRARGLGDCARRRRGWGASACAVDGHAADLAESRAV